MTQEYFCSHCRYVGTITVKDHADVMAVLYALDSDHRLNRPNCAADVMAIRVRNPELCTPEEWTFMTGGKKPEVRKPQ